MTPDATADAASRAALFYDDVLGAANLARAMQVDGIDQEVAALRLRLHETLGDHPEDAQLMLACVNAIVRATASRYRMTGTDVESLRKAIECVVLPLADRVLGPVEEDV